MKRQWSRGSRMADTRLIGLRQAVADADIEGAREQAPMTPFPAPNCFRVWWAPCPPAPLRGPVLALPPLPGAANRYLSAVRNATGFRRARSTGAARRTVPVSGSNSTLMREQVEPCPDGCLRPAAGLKMKRQEVFERMAKAP